MDENFKNPLDKENYNFDPEINNTELDVEKWNDLLLPHAYGGYKKKKKKKARVPVEAEEGVVGTTPTEILVDVFDGYERTPLVGFRGAYFQKPIVRTVVTTGFSRVVSLNEIEVLDLVSEGEIEGLVEGEYSFVGSIGNIGYDSYTYNAYDTAPDTSVRWLRSIFWNDTPVVDSNNQFNFQSISITTTNGTEDGTLLSNSSSELTVTRPIGERLRGKQLDEGAISNDFSKTYRIYNNNVYACRVYVKVNQLFQSFTSGDRAGDIDDASVDYNIYYRPIFSSPNKKFDFELAANERITGKITNGYIRKTQIRFFNSYQYDPDFVGWEIKITRITEDSTSSSLRNQTFIDAITEVYSDTFLYPNSAIIRQKFSAEFFSQIPARAFDLRLLKVLIPNNYDPIKRSYSQSDGAPVGLVGDFWNGEFAETKQWTNNPAWCFYDLLTNRRYGLGKYFDSSYVDKWNLYEIGKYCDELVSDGEGGIEPRFECNVIISSREEAYKVINDFASVFRGLTYYAGGSIQVIQDSPKPVIYTFTNANVMEGNFLYSSSSKRVRHSICIVRYNNKNDFYKPAIEYVQDDEAIKRFGVRELQLTAFGATSRGQARRYAKWALLSERLETENVSFLTGLEGSYLRPGDVIQIHDQNRQSRRLSGRTQKVEYDNLSGLILLDDVFDVVEGNKYNLNLLTPTYSVVSQSITGSTEAEQIRNNCIQSFQIDGSGFFEFNGYTQIYIPEGIEDEHHQVSDNLIWSIELAQGIQTPSVNDQVSGQYEKFRVISIAENEDSQYEVSAITYDEDKFNILESGLTFYSQTVEEVAPASPENLQLVEIPIDSVSKMIGYSFSISSLANVKYFYVYIKKDADFVGGDTDDDQYLAAILSPSELSSAYTASSNGEYYFRVYARGTNLFSSSFASNSHRIFGLDVLNGIQISSLRISTEDTADEQNDAGTWASGIFEDDSPRFVFQAGNVIGLNLDNDYAFRITIRKPNFSNIPSPVIYYEKTGHVFSNISFPEYEFDIATNVASTNGPHREFDIVVESMDFNGESSAGGNFLTNINSNSQNDSTYSNPNGYDIFYAFNPRPTGYFLTPDGGTCIIGPDQSGLICTEQWISQDGEIVISVSTGELDEDIAGGFVYYNTSDFTEEDARNLANGVQRYEFADVEGATVITAVPSNWASVQTGFIALAFYDVFDVGIGTDVTTGLYISNTVKVSRRGTSLDLTSLENEVDSLTESLLLVSGNVDYLSGVLPSWQTDILNNYNLINYFSGILPFWQTDIFTNTTFINYLSGVVNNIISDILENASDIAEISGKIITICDSINLLSGIVEACCGFTGSGEQPVEDVSFEASEEQILCAFSGDSGFLNVVGSGGYDSFDCYDAGEQSGNLVYIHSGWESGWLAQNNYGGRIGTEDFELYDVEVLSSMSVLDGGTGFFDGFAILNNYSGAHGDDTFEQYPTGYVTSGTSLIEGSTPFSGGEGWSGNWTVSDNP